MLWQDLIDRYLLSLFLKGDKYCTLVSLRRDLHWSPFNRSCQKSWWGGSHLWAHVLWRLWKCESCPPRHVFITDKQSLSCKLIVFSTFNVFSFRLTYVVSMRCVCVLQDVKWSDFGFEGRNGRESTLWIGTEGANTPCHLDSYGCNLVLQVQGRWEGFTAFNAPKLPDNKSDGWFYFLPHITRGSDPDRGAMQ